MKYAFFLLLGMVLAGLAFAQVACNDGTPAGMCSANKSKFCSQGGELMDDLARCGCPEGLSPDAAKMKCVSGKGGGLFFIVGNPFNAYDANPLAYVNVKNESQNKSIGAVQPAEAVPSVAEEKKAGNESGKIEEKKKEIEIPPAVSEEKPETGPTTGQTSQIEKTSNDYLLYAGAILAIAIIFVFAYFAHSRKSR